MAFSSGRNKFSNNEIFSDRNSSTIAIMELQPKISLPSFQFGLLKENDSSLGLSGSGAFDGSSNQLTSFIGLSDSIEFLGGKLFGSLYWGKSNPSSNELGLISSISKLDSSSFGVGFLKNTILGSNDKFIFTVNQPLRIESGKIQLNIPTYRTSEKNVLFNSMSLNLNPSGREINTKAEYFTSHKIMNFSLVLGYKSDPYHIKFMDDFWYMSFGFNINI